MSMKVYKVPLYCVKNAVPKQKWLNYIEFVCNIIVVKSSDGSVKEIATEYPLATIPVCFVTPNGEKFIYTSGRVMDKYFISERSFVDTNMSSPNEVLDYFANTDTKWFSIYESELKPLFVEKQKKKRGLFNGIKSL